MDKRPAWREPMLWLVVGLPLASVVAGLMLVASAISSGGADTVSDDVRRTAQIQVTELGPDARAKELKFSAVLRVEGSIVEVLPANGPFKRNQALLLTLSHPTDSMQDRKLILRPSETGWRASGKIPLDHDWIARLAPTNSEWRLHGRLQRGRHATYLAPALAAD